MGERGERLSCRVKVVRAILKMRVGRERHGLCDDGHYDILGFLGTRICITRDISPHQNAEGPRLALMFPCHGQ